VAMIHIDQDGEIGAPKIFKPNPTRLRNIGIDLLEALGYDVSDPAIKDTPRRFAKAWVEFIDYDAGKIDTSFETLNTSQMVMVSGMRVWSMCEHHLFPFWCDLTVAYVTAHKVLGLSKFARIAHKHAHKLQIQERLVHEIADEIQELTESEDVAVVGRGEHLCMVMRGIKTEGNMLTSVMRGQFLEGGPARQEFFELLKHGSG